MDIIPILHALRRNKIAPIFIGLQIGITIAILCNSLSIVEQRLERMRRPSGLDEANIFTLTNRWVGDGDELGARVRGDLAALRALPGVVDASITNSFPLRGYGSGADIMMSSRQARPTTSAAMYLVDGHAQKAWGLRLIGGRWFSDTEVRELNVGSPNQPSPAGIGIVTGSLARQLFRNTPALGRTIYVADGSAVRIVGVVDRAEAPWAAGAFSEAERPSENAVFLPRQFVNRALAYVVRTSPARLSAVMPAALRRLLEVSRARMFAEVHTFSDTRDERYRSDRAVGLMLGTACLLLLVVATCGIFGLTSYSVAERTHQIGVRRAVGARRVDILRYFHTENLLIALAGVVVGIALGMGGDLWLAKHMAIERLRLVYLLSGSLFVLMLCQGAVLWPALRASMISPALAVRSN